MILNKAIPQSDLMGAIASGLCAIHCIATPFLFVAQSCSVSSCCASPFWWSVMDYIFIGITFMAVYWSGKQSNKKWLAYALYASWIALSFLVVNEKMNFLNISVAWKYGMAFILISLHLYNRKFCRCEETKCCTT